MTERSIVEAATRLRRQREPYLIATVVCVHGSAYRRPGARMLLTRFRWVAGSISGGCLEGDISSKGWSLTRDGEPVVVTYDPRAPGSDDDNIRSAFGLGCDGVVEVLLERAGAAGRLDALEVAERCLQAQRRGAIATVFRSDASDLRVGARLALIAGGELETDVDGLDDHVRGLIAEDMHEVIARGVAANRSYALPRGTIDVLIEAVVPPPRVFLFGTGHDAVPVAELARRIGWDVIVCTDQAAFATRDRFAGAEVAAPAELAARIGTSDRAVAVVMNHDLDRDRDSLGLLLETRINYIGVLGPRARTCRLLRELGADDEDPRVHGPVGLDLGAETPAEIALAIIAEIQVVLARSSVANLRDHAGPNRHRSTPAVAA